MELVTETIEVIYKMFEPGELVVPNDVRCGLVTNRVYVVSDVNAPLIPHTLDSMVFVHGYGHGTPSEHVSPITAKELWSQLGDISINCDEEIEESFYQFQRGTHRGDIWAWFEDALDASVAELMGQ